jgi:hypothetical protein
MQPDTNLSPNLPAPTEPAGTSADTPLKSCILPIHPMIKLANAAYRRDLPAMLKTHYRKWVAYHGDRRLGFGNDKTKLILEWLKRGIPDEELMVRGIEPDMPYDEETDEYIL